MEKDRISFISFFSCTCVEIYVVQTCTVWTSWQLQVCQCVMISLFCWYGSIIWLITKTIRYLSQYAQSYQSAWEDGRQTHSTPVCVFSSMGCLHTFHKSKLIDEHVHTWTHLPNRLVSSANNIYLWSWIIMNSTAYGESERQGTCFSISHRIMHGSNGFDWYANNALVFPLAPRILRNDCK